jgi:L-Ala-D/L-Glu epimerase
MLKLTVHTYNNPFEHPFTISKGTKTHQPTLVVSLAVGNWVGYGEAPAINYYNVTVESMVQLLESKRQLIESYSIIDPQRFWHFLHHLFGNNNFLICALDIAAWDLWGKMKGKSISKLIDAPAYDSLQTDYTIGIDTEEKMLAKMQAKPWPIYKIKCGTLSDLEKIKTLRNNTSSVFRLDANAGWSLNDALEILPQLQNLNIEIVEQPLAKDAWDAMLTLKQQQYNFALMADEACVVEQDVDKCFGYFDGINIKLTKCGGITPALRMIANARSKGLKIMIGCMNETTIGSAAMAQLASLVDFIDMDGPLLLTQDVATGITYNNGAFSINQNKFGLGIQFTGNEATAYTIA